MLYHGMQVCKGGQNYLKYRKYPNLVRSQVEVISDPDYLVRILFER